MKFPFVRKGLFLVILSTILSIVASGFIFAFNETVALIITFVVAGLSVLELIGYIICGMDKEKYFFEAAVLLVISIIWTVVFAVLNACGVTYPDFLENVEPVWSMCVVLSVTLGCRSVSKKLKKGVGFITVVLVICLILLAAQIGLKFWSGSVADAAFKGGLGIALGSLALVQEVLYFIMICIVHHRIRTA